MKKFAIPLVVSCSWLVMAFNILLGAIHTQQPGRITAAIGTAIPLGMVLLIVRQLMKLRTKHLGA